MTRPQGYSRITNVDCLENGKLRVEERMLEDRGRATLAEKSAFL